MVQQFFKYLGLVIALVGSLSYIVLNHSISKEMYFLCKGDYSQDASKSGGDLYFTWRTYSWFVHLWSDNDGDVFIETEDGYIDAYTDVKIVVGYRQLRLKDKYSTSPLDLKGQYNFPSKKLWLKSTPSGTFNGTCEETGER